VIFENRAKGGNSCLEEPPTNVTQTHNKKIKKKRKGKEIMKGNFKQLRVKWD
jgi:hypothetical protein